MRYDDETFETFEDHDYDELASEELPPTAAGLRGKLLTLGYDDDAVGLIVRATAHQRHQARVQATIDAVLAAADGDERLAAQILRLDLDTPRTRRFTWAAGLGTGRWHANDGAAWRGAAEQAYKDIGGDWKLDCAAVHAIVKRCESKEDVELCLQWAERAIVYAAVGRAGGTENGFEWYGRRIRDKVYGAGTFATLAARLRDVCKYKIRALEERERAKVEHDEEQSAQEPTTTRPRKVLR